MNIRPSPGARLEAPPSRITWLRRWPTASSFLALAAILLLVGCGSDASIEPGAEDTAPDSVLSVTALLDGPTDLTVRVNGFLFIDDRGSLLCELLLESYPPQCGGPSVAIENPEAAGEDLDETQGIRWTPNPIEIVATWDGVALTVE